jgi:hypothetical protein
MALTGLQSLTSGFGMGTSLAGGAAKAGGLASLGFGPLAANTQRREGVRARNEAKRVMRADLGRQLALPEMDFARQGFGQALGGQLSATNPFISELGARDTRSRMAISGANPFDIALAGRFMGA